MVVESDWHGLYAGRWNNEIVPESMSHPAKFSRKLIQRIYEFALEEGMLAPGDTVIDPFGGVALGALDAMYNGLNWIGVEIEPRFVLLGNGGDCDGKTEVLGEHEETIPGHPGYSGWYVVMPPDEDDDRFRYIGVGGRLYFSEPGGNGYPARCDAQEYWAENEGPDDPPMRVAFMEREPEPDETRIVQDIKPAPCGKKEDHEPHHVLGNIEHWNKKYGEALKDRWGRAVLLQGDSRYLPKVLRDNGLLMDGGLTSPPYMGGGHHPDQTGAWGGQAQSVDRDLSGYGGEPGQMGQMEGDEDGFDSALSSPPFRGQSADGGWQMLGRYAKEGKLTVKQVDGDSGKLYPSWDPDRDTSYGESEGQLADMEEGKIDGAITSPPFQAQSGGTNVTSTEGPLSDKRLLDRHSAGNKAARGYGEGEANIANLPGDENGLDLALGSPPYADIPQTGGTKGLKEHGTGLTRGERFFDEYGDEAGQLGRMRADGTEMALGSPPYANSEVCRLAGQEDADQRKSARAAGEWEGYNRDNAANLGSMADDNLDGALSSPPYAGARIGQESGQEQCGHSDAYGAQEGQLGAMDASVTSPPFEGVTANRPSQQLLDSVAAGELPHFGPAQYGEGYGETPGNIGDEWGEDFWTASRMILDNLYAVLRPGAAAIFVVKAYVKDKQLVDFPDQWRQVCEAAGFEWTHRIKAWVIEHKGIQYDMFSDEPVEIVTERKSFFRRLAESKGSPRIDFEEVLIFRKPAPIIVEALALGARVSELAPA